MNISELTKFLDQKVRLNFRDGEIVDATLFVANIERDRDITYEILQVLKRSPLGDSPSRPGVVIVASLDELLSFEPIGKDTLEKSGNCDDRG